MLLDRDLTPENILVSSTGTIKLTDFGGSADFSSASTASKRNGFVDETQGTWAFWAPEICASNDLSAYSAFRSDVWATMKQDIVFVILATLVLIARKVCPDFPCPPPPLTSTHLTILYQ